jgi:hypothetical protein
VEIFVPFGNDDEGHFATGYPVSNDFILTARHVLFPDNRNQNRAIECRWHFLETEWKPLEDDAIVWDGGDELDAALIRFPLPDDQQLSRIFSSALPSPTESWWSRGFAKVGKQANQKRPAIGMIGKIISANPASNSCELGVDYKADDQGAKQWQGVSGCPIVCRNSIIGITKSAPTIFKGKRLDITLVSVLLDNTEFRNKVGFDEAKRRFEQAVKRLARKLDQSEAATNAIKQQLPNNVEYVLDNQSLSEALLGLTFDQMITLIDFAIAELNDAEELNAIAILKELSCSLMPIVFDSGTIDSMRKNCQQSGVSLINLPVCTATLAELIMAGIDNRASSYKPLAETKTWPIGLHCLEPLPEAGIWQNDNSFVKRFHEVMIDEFLGDDEKNRNPPLDNEQKIRRAAHMLEGLAKPPDAQTRYVFYQEEGDDISQSIVELKAAYPALVFLSLNSDNEDFLQEAQRIQRLPTMLMAEQPDSGN